MMRIIKGASQEGRATRVTTTRRSHRAPRPSTAGFGVIEIVVAVAIIGIVFFGIYEFALVSSTSVHASSRQIAAGYLAQEAVEIVRTKRNSSWDTDIATLSTGTPYYPNLVSNSWSLSLSNPGLIDNLYTRTVVLQDVLRDNDDNIASSGTVDPDTRKVTVTVSWDEKNGSQQIVLETYVTNFLQN